MSTFAANSLEALGYSEVSVLSGAIESWKAESCVMADEYAICRLVFTFHSSPLVQLRAGINLCPP